MDEPRTPQDPQVDQPAPPAHRVRRAGPGDVAAMHAMVVELAEYERSPESVQATAEDLHAALFGGADERVAHAHVAEVRDAAGAQGWQVWQVVGMAVWFPTYSTWTGRAGIWLEDLYVRPDHRGLGLGSALLAALAATCVRAGHRRLEWTVLDWNTSAQGVYRSVGATPMEDWTTWRLDGDALGALAATGTAAPAGPSGDPGSG